MAEGRFTDFNLRYDLIDLSALEDVDFISSQNKSFADLDNLKSAVEFPDYLTWEHNHNILDGSMEHFQQSTYTTNNIGFFSTDKSDVEGGFTVNPKLVLAFSDTHTSIGLTLYFVSDPPLKLSITWYNGQDIILSEEFSVSSKVFFVDKSIKMYNRVEIEFTEAVPDRYIKLYYILFGKQFDWDETIIKSGKLVQEVNMLADKLSINTLTFSIIDAENTMNFGNNANIIDYFTRLQPMYPKITINDNTIPLGNYYLEKVEVENNIASVTAFSSMGLLDTVDFNDGDIYNGTLAGVVLEDIFELAGITSYYIDSATYNVPLYGTIKPCTCREALQKVLFVCGAIVRTNSNEYQMIVEQPTTSLSTKITREYKINTKVSDAEYVTGVKLGYTVFELSDTADKISTDTYDEGTHLIIFSQPYKDVYLDDNSITVTKTSTYYIEFVLESRTTVTIYGKSYTATTNDITATRQIIKPGAIKNVKSFSTELCDYLRASQLAYRLLNYYVSSSLDISIKTIASDNTMTGKQIVYNNIAELSNYVGRYSSRVFDLTGGFIDDSKLVGYYASSGSDEYYTSSSELFTNKEDMYTGDYLI